MPVAAAGGAVAEEAEGDARSSPGTCIASAAPAATGTEAAMALMMATMFSPMSPMCMLPSRPRGEARRRGPCTARRCARRHAADQKQPPCRGATGDSTSSGSASNRAADRDGFLAAADVHAAHDFALPVELALDAVFHLPHHRHVVETLVRKACRLAGGVFGMRSNGVYRAHRYPLASVNGQR